MKTSVTELGDSRVRVDVGIEPEAVERGLERAATGLAREMKMPGFRKGKVPAQLIIQRMGRDAVLEQALRDSLPEWYERALLDAGISPVGEPELKVPSLPEAGQELAFSIEVAVRPEAKLGEYKGLEVGRPEAEVPDEMVDSELDRLREGFASLEPVDRAGGEGDLLVIDYEGTADGEPFEGSEATDLMVELGAESLLPEFDRALAGRIGGRRGDGRGSLPGRPPARGPGGEERELRGRGQGGAREEAARARRRVRLGGIGVRDARGASRRDSDAESPRRSRPARTTSFVRRRSTPRPRPPRSRSPRSSSTLAPTRCGSDSSARSRRAASTRRRTFRCRERTARRW